MLCVLAATLDGQVDGKINRKQTVNALTRKIVDN